MQEQILKHFKTRIFQGPMAMREVNILIKAFFNNQTTKLAIERQSVIINNAASISQL